MIGRILWVLLLSLCLSLIFTPFFSFLARKVKFFYWPTATSVNKKPVPLLGGAALFLSFLIAMSIFGGLSIKDWGVIVSASILFILGLFDDAFHLSPSSQLIGIFLSASLAVGFGVRIQFFSNPFGANPLLLEVLSIPISIFWIAALTSAIKIMDGLDGLAAGICAISSLTLFAVALFNNFLPSGSPTVLASLLALAGACLGFLPFNFHPAKIFMGEAGILFIGFVLASLTIEAMVKSTSLISLSIPLVALALPILNILFAVIRRSLKGKAVFQADREHIHDLLLKKLGSHRRAVLVLYALSTILGAISFFISQTSFRWTLITWLLLTGVLIFGAWKIGLVGTRNSQ